MVASVFDEDSINCPSCGRQEANCWYCDKCFKNQKRVGAKEVEVKLLQEFYSLLNKLEADFEFCKDEYMNDKYSKYLLEKRVEIGKRLSQLNGTKEKGFG